MSLLKKQELSVFNLDEIKVGDILKVKLPHMSNILTAVVTNAELFKLEMTSLTHLIKLDTKYSFEITPSESKHYDLEKLWSCEQGGVNNAIQSQVRNIW